jgi:hypothetical protein
MRWIEMKLKRSRFTPLKVIGEIIFGSKGEIWEEQLYNNMND